MNAYASFETQCALRHMTALCEHFGRKVAAACEGQSGWVEFAFGRCDMTADAVRLDLKASAQTQPDLEQVVQVVNSHLERFAFRENPRLDWRFPPETRLNKETLT